METRNDIIELCAAVVDTCNSEGPYNAIAAAKRIRLLKDESLLNVNAPMRPLRTYWRCGSYLLEDRMLVLAAEAMHPANNDQKVELARIVAERVGIPNAMSGEYQFRQSGIVA